jgi:hypothetical protein
MKGWVHRYPPLHILVGLRVSVSGGDLHRQHTQDLHCTVLSGGRTVVQWSVEYNRAFSVSNAKFASPRSEIVTDQRKAKTTVEAALSLQLSSLVTHLGVCPSLIFGQYHSTSSRTSVMTVPIGTPCRRNFFHGSGSLAIHGPINS